MLKKNNLIAFLGAFLFGLSSCSKDEVAVTSLTLSEQTVTLEKGYSTKLVATISPSDSSNPNVIWKSEDESIATVTNNGVVNAIKGGITTITAKSEDGGFTASCQIIVNIAVSNLILSEQTVTLEKGTNTTLIATISPSDSSNPNILWKSEDESIATVTNNGAVSAIKTGTTTITAITEDGGFTASCQIIVKVDVTGLEISETSLSLTKGLQKQLSVSFFPIDATNRDITWTSSDSNIVSVDGNGLVKALKVGKASIIVISESGSKEAKCDIEVTSAEDIEYNPYGDKEEW